MHLVGMMDVCTKFCRLDALNAVQLDNEKNNQFTLITLFLTLLLYYRYFSRLWLSFDATPVELPLTLRLPVRVCYLAIK